MSRQAILDFLAAKGMDNASRKRLSAVLERLPDVTVDAALADLQTTPEAPEPLGAEVHLARGLEWWRVARFATQAEAVAFAEGWRRGTERLCLGSSLRVVVGNTVVHRAGSSLLTDWDDLTVHRDYTKE